MFRVLGGWLGLSGLKVVFTHNYEVVVEFVKVMQCCFNTSAFQEGGPVKGLDHHAHVWCLAAVMLYPLGCLSLTISNAPTPLALAYPIQCSCTPAAGKHLLCMPGLSLWQSLS